MWTQIEAAITESTGEKFQIQNRRSVGGGCINQGYAVTDGQRTYFVKLNQASLVEMFDAEALGLKQMLETRSIRVPKPICSGSAGNSAYLVLEWLELGRGGNQSWEEMGRQLAAMHRWHPPQPPLIKGGSTGEFSSATQQGSTGEFSSATQQGSKEEFSPLSKGGSNTESPPLTKGGQGGFGWNRNNTIGSTPQINTWTQDWTEFFAQHRIGYQLKQALRRGGHFPLGERMLAAIPELLAKHDPQPSLVHGDLWGGNAGFTAGGEPVIFDPAAYFGDREVDIAMTELFGGFPAAFYRGYNEVFPLDAGYERRKTLYNLYHILNHFNLFGGGYGSQANRMIEQILA